MGELVENLNYEFNYNVFLAKSLLPLVSNTNDRQRVIRWIRKLTTCNRSINEMRLRNDFMFYLIHNMKYDELLPPFTENPPPGALPTIAHLIPGGAEAVKKALDDAGQWIDKSGPPGATGPNQPLLYQHSPDGGAFLASQPVPRCGAFCYLAVVSKSDRNDE